MDRSRNLMYLLGRNGSISVWDLGADGEGCTKFVTIPVTKIAHEALILTQFGHDESSFHNITAIKALEASQSAALNLVATTSKGVRLYLSLSTGPQNTVGQINNSGKINERNRPQVSVRPQCLRVAHVRFAPGVTPTSIYGDGPNGVSVVYADECRLKQSLREFSVKFIFFSNLCHGHRQSQHNIRILQLLLPGISIFYRIIGIPNPKTQKT